MAVCVFFGTFARTALSGDRMGGANFMAYFPFFADIEGMKYHTDADEIALLGLCDRLGRTGSKRKEEEENIRLFLQACDIYPVSQKPHRKD